MSDGAFSAPSSSSENDSDNESTIGLDSFFDSALEFKKKRYEFAGGAIHQDVWVSTGICFRSCSWLCRCDSIDGV